MWSYIVGAITTPLYIIIPLLTIWVGVFPIAISWWAALALTMYYIAQSLVLNYCKKVMGNPEDPGPAAALDTHVHVCAGCQADMLSGTIRHEGGRCDLKMEFRKPAELQCCPDKH